MSAQPIPEGYHTITPYLIVDDIKELLAFLQAAFDADVTERIEMPDGSVSHAEARIGDSRVMMGQARDEWKAQSAMLYLYVEDADATYQRALEAGAVSVQEPHDEFYGDRNAGVKGPQGNHWWIATHIEDVSSEEIARRAAQLGAPAE